MNAGLIVTVADPDDDYLGLEISARNARFAGSARIYTSRDELILFINAITGFPVSASDSRCYTFGHFSRGFAGGEVEAHFLCKNAAGKCMTTLRFMDDQARYGAGTAEFSLSFEPATLDRFLAELRKLCTAPIGASATLDAGQSFV